MAWYVSQLGRHDCCHSMLDGKQYRDSIVMPSTWHPSPSLNALDFRSQEVRRPLLDLDFYGGTDSFGMFPFF